MRIFIFTLALAISGVAKAQDTNSSWWESYNKQSSQTAVRNKPDRSPFATKVQASLNVDWMSGKGAEGIEGDVGYSFGLSEDFFNNKSYGVEIGAYYSRSNLSVGIGNDYNTTMGLDYYEFQAMFNPRLFFGNNSVELNLGVAYNLGLAGSIKYKSENLHMNPFSDKDGNKVLKDNHISMLYGLTYRGNHFYFRTLIHEGMTNINAASSEKKGFLWNCDLSLGYIF